MKKRIINYVKKWDSKGYTYDQTVKITEPEFQNINKHINTLACNEDFMENLACEKRSFITPLESINSICFTSHTVRNIVSEFLNIKIKDRNTIFEIV